jgi:hypothetical protein
MKHLLLIALLLSGACLAQERDFLTPDEADQVREVQEPNKRLALYVKFAQVRMELLKQSLASTKPGRSVFIHDTLEELTKVIEAIDTVSDDAIRRKVDIDKGLAAVLDAEKPIIEELNKIVETPPKDYARYKFTIEQAVETLQDSVELAGQDLKTRGAELAKKDKKDKAERDEIGTSTDAKEAAEKMAKKEAGAAANAPGAPPAKKAPTLRRKGEVVPDKPQQ